MGNEDSLTAEAVAGFLQHCISGPLGAEWKVLKRGAVVRDAEDFLVGVYFGRIGSDRVRPVFFCQLYGVPSGDLELSLGHFFFSSGSLAARFLGKRKQYAFEWSKRLSRIDEILEFIRSETSRYWGQSFTLTGLCNWIDSELGAVEHPKIFWSRGIAEALLEQDREGIRFLRMAQTVYRAGSEEFAGLSPERAAHEAECARNIGNLTRAIENGETRSYLLPIAEKTKAALIRGAK